MKNIKIKKTSKLINMVIYIIIIFIIIIIIILVWNSKSKKCCWTFIPKWYDKKYKTN